MKSLYFSFILTLALLTNSGVYAQTSSVVTKFNPVVDNQGYWKGAAEAGFTKPNPMRSAPPAIYTGSEIRAVSVITDDSPDVVIITGATSQSENSVFVNPNDQFNALNSNNSTNQPSGGTSFYGADYLYTFDAGETWGGSMIGAGGANSGDPTTSIGLNGRYYIGYITNSYGIGTSYSDNQGSSWTMVNVANNPGGSGLDKNHLWIDNSPTSPYEGNLYHAWTAFGGGNNNDIEISISTSDGTSWSSPQNISSQCNAGSHCQGVNVQTGPNGEVYATFSIYDGSGNEDALGFARSFNGGQTWENYRILDNIRGIRAIGCGKNMRSNSFPSMSCDLSSGPNRGNIYIVFSNAGFPGINSGSDVDIYIIRSEDNGETWTDPVKVNQDPSGQGKKHYFSWITCDPANSTLSVIFYDDRNVSSSQVEVFCANSTDQGETWEDFKVSDVAFTPSPIPGMASQYMGDYLGISARNGKVYPVWTDTRTGTALAYCSPYETSTMIAPASLTAQLNEETGQVNLTWSHETGPTFDHYNIYRGFGLIGSTTFPFYTDQLPDYGIYRYQVTAVYTIEGESGPAIADVQWGNGQAETDPGSIEVFVLPEGTTSTVMGLTNVGELPLEYTSDFGIAEASRETNAYCTGIGGCGGEGIAGVIYGDVSNFSACNSYEDFSTLSHLVTRGDTIAITINNLTNIYPTDVCGIWVDWNQNESFSDDPAIAVSGTPGPGPYTATIIVPDDAKNGMARLRIRIRRGGTLSPCGSAPNGEVEDYSVNVLAWVTATPMEGTIDPGSAQDVTFNFDAAGLGLGDYLANYTIYSNDPDGDLVIPVTMHVANAAVNITTNKDSLCFGGSATLNAVVTGGSGTYTYSWTSNPPGFVSDEASPLVTPLVTTTYFVEVSDGSIILNDQITITVLAVPLIDLGTDVAICQGSTAMLDAGPGFIHYFWSTGETSQSIIVTQPGNYWVEVTNQFECSARDTLLLAVNPIPTVSLGADDIICEGSSVMLTAGTGFATYLWSNGAIDYFINVTEPGEYWVLVTDDNGCSNNDTIILTSVPKPEVSLGNDQEFCEGSPVTLDAGSGFASYLWSNNASTQTIQVSQGGEYWVEVTDETTCSNRDTVMLTMDPLPVAPETISGPSSVDNFSSPSSGFTCSESLYAATYEWVLEPAGAGNIIVIGGGGPEATIEWVASFTGTANITVRGWNDCGSGNFSQTYPVTVYSSQSIDERDILTGIKLFPNPSNGVFVLQFISGKAQELRFRITTSGGNQVLESKENIPTGMYEKNFNIRNLSKGTYYLVISDKDGRMLNREQVVVQ